MSWFEDIQLGVKTDLGTYTFTEEAIVAFAKKWDPQPVHIDPIAAQSGPYGGLIASGWHVCVIWMRKIVDNRFGRDSEESEDSGQAEGQRQGVSPGFLDLNWHAPVRPGDTLHYFTTTHEKVELKSRPDMGIIRTYNEAINQDGVRVMSFIGQGLTARRPKGE